MVATWSGAWTSTAAVEVVATAITKAPVFSGMDKGLDVCLEQDFESKFPTKEIGPFKNNEKEAVN